MKYSTAEIHEIIERDGLAETIKTISFKRIDDPVLSDLFEEVQSLFERITEYVDDNKDDFGDTDEDDEEYD